MPEPRTRLYLRGLPDGLGINEVSKHLTGYGKLREVKIHKGYGFVDFNSEKDATLTYDILQSNPILGEGITAEYARPLRKAASRRDNDQVKPRYPVLVKNIPRGTCWQELKDFARLAGGFVAFCNIDKSRRTGFIEYPSRHDAHQAVSQLSGRKLGNQMVTLCMPEDEENIKPAASSRRWRSRSRSPCRDHAYQLEHQAIPTSDMGRDKAYQDKHEQDTTLTSERFDYRAYPAQYGPYGTSASDLSFPRFRDPYETQRDCSYTSYTSQSFESQDTSSTEALPERFDPYADGYYHDRQPHQAPLATTSHAYDHYESSVYYQEDSRSHNYATESCRYDDSRWAYN